MYQIKTSRGYLLSEVVSAMQKAIRRADTRMAGYWAVEMWESGYAAYCWRRLLTVSAEDVWGIVTHEIVALEIAYNTINKAAAKGKPRGRIFIAKAIILLCEAKKSRDADHLTNLVYDKINVPENAIDEALDEARKSPEKIPDYAHDCHTNAGRKAGKTKGDFFRDEFAALTPREPGLFDDLVCTA